MRRIYLGALVVGLTGVATAARAVVLTPAGRFTFSAPSSSASELSGLTYVAGNQYYAVSDHDAKLYTLNIAVNPVGGAVTSAAIALSPLQLRDASGASYATANIDFEGVAYNPLHNSVFISDELGPTIHEQSLASGNEILRADPSTANELQVYAGIRANAGWESMTRQAGGAVLWTANQEPLTDDGPKASLNSPAPIRLQKLTGSLAPVAQYAYQLDANDAETGWTAMSSSGVSDLLVLPDGLLIALERAKGTGGTHGNATDMRVRLYLVDPSHATDLAGNGLASPTYVAKTLLWENFFDAADNNQFEGITLGPTLSNGDGSVLMIADNGGGTAHTLFAFDASGIPEPATGVAALAGLALLSRRRRLDAPHLRPALPAANATLLP